MSQFFFFFLGPQKFFLEGFFIIEGKNIYQLIVQKQIGATNSDFVLEFETDNKTTFSNQNFSPIVKDNKIIYNTSLSTDKIFLIELINN